MSTKSTTHETAGQANATLTKSGPPPDPGAFKAVSKPIKATPAPEEKKKSLLGRIWPFKPAVGSPFYLADKNEARGIQEARQALTTGVLHPRYRPAALRITLAIIFLPIAIVTSKELWERRFMGKEKRQHTLGVKNQHTATT